MAFGLQAIIISALLAPENSMLYPGLFPGGVLDQMPKAGHGTGATPNAFYGQEDPLRAGKLKNTIAVFDGGANPAPDGAARNGFVGFPLVYGFAEAGDDGEAALRTLDTRIHATFHRRRSFALGDGTGVELVTLEDQPLIVTDDMGYPGRILKIWRIQGTFIRAAVPV